MEKGSPPAPATTAAAATVDALIRELLAEGGPRLVFEREIGRGGIGAVSVVFDRALRRRAAMKTLHPRAYDEQLLVRGFIREAQITGQLGHPNIVPIFDFGVDEGRLFFTMKLVEGRGLNRLLAQRQAGGGDLSHDYERVLNLVEILIKVLDAVAFAHSRGVLHCDLKSENVMVGDYGEVYLMDWGGAQLLRPRPGVDASRWVQGILDELPGESTEGLVFGTPAYMSPEQAHGRRSKMDERADIFSLGAILYELLCGRAPYRAGSNLEALRLAQRYAIPPLDDLVDRAVVPRELVRIAMKAMAREPDDRYPSVAAMKLDLLRLLRGGSSFPVARFPAGAAIIREGEVGEAAYSIVSGRVEAHREVDGERVSLRVMGPGEVFGETAIFAASPRTASVTALTDVALVVITGEAINHEMDAMKPWMGAFIRALATRFAGAEARARRTAPVPAPAPAAPPPSDAALALSEASRALSDALRPPSEATRPGGESLLIDIDDQGASTELLRPERRAAPEREVTILTEADEASDLAGRDDESEVDLEF